MLHGVPTATAKDVSVAIQRRRAVEEQIVALRALREKGSLLEGLRTFRDALGGAGGGEREARVKALRDAAHEVEALERDTAAHIERSIAKLEDERRALDRVVDVLRRSAETTKDSASGKG